MKPVVVIPVRDDYKSASLVIQQLKSLIELEILIIDDGSSDIPLSFLNSNWPCKVILTNKKRGSQSAIYQGIKESVKIFPNHPIIVMDGDGEDRPEDLIVLMEAYRNSVKELTKGFPQFKANVLDVKHNNVKVEDNFVGREGGGGQ